MDIQKTINEAGSYSSFVQASGSVTTANYSGDYTAGGTTGTFTTNACCNGCGGYYYNWWPHYCGTSENKTEKAYKVVRALMKAKLVKITTLDKFFTLMDEIQKVI